MDPTKQKLAYTSLKAQQVLVTQREALLDKLDKRYHRNRKAYRVAAIAIRRRAGSKPSVSILNPQYLDHISSVIRKKRQPSVSVGDTLMRRKAAEEGERYAEWELECEIECGAGAAADQTCNSGSTDDTDQDMFRFE